jgi:hypothetical protein
MTMPINLTLERGEQGKRGERGERGEKDGTVERRESKKLELGRIDFITGVIIKAAFYRKYELNLQTAEAA